MVEFTAISIDPIMAVQTFAPERKNVVGCEGGSTSVWQSWQTAMEKVDKSLSWQSAHLKGNPLAVRA